jgi:hypothetical protein
MIAEQDFKMFYNDKLLPALDELEVKRRKLVPKLILLIIITLALIIVDWIILNKHDVAASFIMLALFISFVFLYFKFTKDYIAEFKFGIIRQMLGFIDQELIYDPKLKIEKEDYLTSRIFTSHISRYNGEDFVSGRIGAINVKFSELHTEIKINAGKNTHYQTIFKGIFFIADFNKKFKSQTVVLPDNAEKMFGWLGQELQSLDHSRGDLVRLEDPEFEKEFCVYGTDQVEARYVLSVSLMRRILDFKNKIGTRIHLSFVDSRVYVAISLQENLFEPRIFGSIKDYSFIEKNFHYFQLFLGIVDDLNLNNRIWNSLN